PVRGEHVVARADASRRGAACSLTLPAPLALPAGYDAGHIAPSPPGPTLVPGRTRHDPALRLRQRLIGSSRPDGRRHRPTPPESARALQAGRHQPLLRSPSLTARGGPVGAFLPPLNPPPPAKGPQHVVLDVRGLEPPQPMLRVLEALDAADELEVWLDRRPVFLYPQIEERGFEHDPSEPAPGLVRVFIRRRRA